MGWLLILTPAIMGLKELNQDDEQIYTTTFSKVSGDFRMDQTIEMDFSSIPGVNFAFNENPDPTVIEDLLGNLGKASRLFIIPYRKLNEDDRLELYGFGIWRVYRYNGQEHVEDVTLNVEVKVSINGTVHYGGGDYKSHVVWSGLRPLYLEIDALEFWWNEPKIVEEIHIYGERIVDDYPPEQYDLVFNRFIINAASSSSQPSTPQNQPNSQPSTPSNPNNN